MWQEWIIHAILTMLDDTSTTLTYWAERARLGPMMTRLYADTDLVLVSNRRWTGGVGLYLSPRSTHASQLTINPLHTMCSAQVA